MKRNCVVFCAAILALLWGFSADAATYTVYDGEFVDMEDVPTMSVEEHYNHGAEAFENRDWVEASKHFKIVTLNFPEMQCAKDGYLYLGIACYYRAEYEDANDACSNYLKAQNHPQYLEEALRYKLAIANAFTDGAKRRILKYKTMPKWLSGYDNALQIYDEIIATYPCHDLAAQALYSKGVLHWRDKEYRESVEAFQMLIRRFPKHELAPDSYAVINKVYLEQCQQEYQNPDILAFAELNTKKFAQDFPGEEKVAQAEDDVKKIREIFAFGFYDTGQFYERLKQPEASMIYYKNAVKQFPDTYMAHQCRKRLDALGVGEDELATAPMDE